MPDTTPAAPPDHIDNMMSYGITPRTLEKALIDGTWNDLVERWRGRIPPKNFQLARKRWIASIPAGAQ